MSRALKRGSLIIFMLILNVGIILGLYEWSINQYRTENNQRIAVLAGLITDDEVKISERKEILLKTLQSKAPLIECEGISSSEFCGYVKRGQDLFAKYGYKEGDFYENESKIFISRMVAVTIFLVLIDWLIIILFEAISERKLRKNLNELLKYFEQLIEKDYDLAVPSSSENEFSKLKNELYKVTVLLRKTAENNIIFRKKLETALEDISHQLKTPLTALQITLDNLCAEKPLSKELEKEFLGTARRQVESMAELVVTLLNLAKFDNKTIKLQPKNLEVSTLLESAIEKVAVLAEIQNVKTVLEGDLKATVHLDAAWQTEALANIIKNSIEFSPMGEMVLVQVEDCPLFIKITITDHGPGISLSDQKHLFERFYQTAQAKEGHVGIGLNFAKTIIEAELGRVTVKSKLYKGTSFTVTYPK